MAKLKALGCALAAVLLATSTGTAFAAANQTYVSKRSGNDGNTANNCNIIQPCLTIAAALSVTNAGGSLQLVDGRFDESFTISTALTISAIDGAYIVGNGLSPVITVAAGAGDRVAIRNTVVAGGPTSVAGVQFTSGKSLTISGSRIQGASGTGINFVPSSPASGQTQLFLNDTQVVQSNGGNITIRPTADMNVGVRLVNVLTRNSGTWGLKLDGSGMTTAGNITADVVESIMSNNDTNGIIVTSDTGQGNVRLMIDHSHTIHNQAFGLVAVGAQSFVFVNKSTASFNQTGIGQLSGSIVASYQNNAVNFNTTQTSGTITSVPLR